MSDYAPSGKEGEPKRKSRKSRAKEGKSGGDGGDSGGGGSGSGNAEADAIKGEIRKQQEIAIMSEGVMDKLKMLNYDDRFCGKFSLPPISQHYFMFSSSAAEQLQYFATLVSWLLSFQGVQLAAPEEYGDPNETVSNMLAELKKIGADQGASSTSLMSGSGQEVVQILNTLVQEGLKRDGWNWERPVIPVEAVQQESMDETPTEIGADTADDADEIEDNFSDDDDDAFIDVETMHVVGTVAADDGSKDLLSADIDAAEWRTEVERVLPQLKVHLKSDVKDWRHHVEKMGEYQAQIDGSMKDTHTHLDKLHSEISKTLEKIEAREKYVNKQLENLINDFRQEHDKLHSKQEQYKAEGGRVTELTRDLANLSDELDTVKTQMDERGNNMTDQGPLVKVKQAMTRLKSEIAQMELRIGVVQHTLLGSKIQSKKHMVNDMHRDPVTHEEWI